MSDRSTSGSGGSPNCLIAIGASAGGVEALLHLARGLPPDLAAAILVVVHVPPNAPSILPELLTRAGPLPASHARDGEPILPGHIYVAPPNCHLLVEDDCLRLSSGPRENHSRPAVDPLFRSAALRYGPRVIGVVLSGALSDGTAGLWEIKERGGRAVVQDPGEALYPSMPHSAIDQVPVDHVLPVAEIPDLLARLVREPPKPAQAETETETVTETLFDGERGDEVMEAREAREAKEAIKDRNPEAFPGSAEAFPGSAEAFPGSAEVDRDMATQIAGERDRAVSVYVCPDCGGSLWQVNAGPFPRFRCHVGHTYGGEDLLEGYTADMEQLLWRVVRSFRDKANLTRQLEARARKRGDAARAADYAERARRDDKNGAAVERMIGPAEAVNRGTAPVSAVSG